MALTTKLDSNIGKPKSCLVKLWNQLWQQQLLVTTQLLRSFPFLLCWNIQDYLEIASSAPPLETYVVISSY